MTKTYTNLKKLEEKHGEVEFQAEITMEALETGISHALAHAAKNFELPGFRKGKVPEHIVRERVDEMELLETAADETLREAVREIIADGDLSIVGSPRLIITKLAPKNPVAFKVRFALYPEITLPDYKKIGAEIASRKGDVEVGEKEVDEAIKRLLTIMAGQKKEGEEKEPELTDDLVKQFGPFKTVEEFKTKLKENLARDKELGDKEKRREEIMREIVKQTKAKLPGLLMDEEWYAFEERRNAELEAAKLSLEDYLKQNNQTEKQLEAHERGLIEERIKTSMIFREIQKQENITAEEKEIQTNIAYLKLRYPDRNEHWLRETAEALIIQEKIFSILGLPIGNPLEQ